VLWDTGAKKTAVRNSLALVNNDKVDRTSSAMLNGIPGSCAAAHYRFHRSV
jgi:hypothetical protein